MTKEYTVNVDEKTYHITVEHNNNPSINHTDFSEELSYESTKAEYDHCVQRSEKLDNKVYILLTVYAFLFVLLCDIIKKISCFSFPGNKTQLALIITYSIFLTLDIILYIFTLIKLIHLLKGVAIERFNPYYYFHIVCYTIFEINNTSNYKQCQKNYIHFYKWILYIFFYL